MAFVGLGTLDIAGTVGAQIAVTLSQVAGIGLLDTINISNAKVTLGGVAGVSALVDYNIGSGGLLDIASAVGLAAGTTFTFAGANSRLTLGAGVDVSVLGGVRGFGSGSSIDVAPLAGSLSYVDSPGADTGGTLVLRDTSGAVVDTIRLLTGDFTTSSFTLTPDGTGGTLVGVATTVTGVTASPSTADLGAGQTATFSVALTDPVTVSGGTPTLTLSDGGIATYDAGASTGTMLVFTHTVAPGENSPDLAIGAVNLGGAAVINAGGTPVDLTAAAINPIGILQVDTVAPTVAGVGANPASGAVGAGQVVTLTVMTSEPVAVTGGPPTLTLNDGGTATYAPGASTPTSLVFTSTVAPGQNAADLAVTAIDLKGGVIADGAGNAADLSGAITNPAGVLKIDTIAPTVQGVATAPATGMLGAGQTIAIMVTTSEPVGVAGGVPTLTLSDGAVASYDPLASTPSVLVFTTTVASGQNSPDLAVIAVNPNGATIGDAAGNAADLSGAIGNPAGVLTIDTTPPFVTGVSATPASGALGAGQMVTLTVATSEPVTIAGGAPTLSLNDGGVAAYDPAASTPTSLVFTTTVAPGQNSQDLAVTALNLGGAAITDGAGNRLDPSGAAVNPAGALVIDTTPPAVATVTTNPASGTVTGGQTITISVGTTEPVIVTGGPPTLSLSDGGSAIYDPVNSTPSTLVFETTVMPGQSTGDLSVAGLNLNGGTIKDAAGNPIDASGAAVNPAGTLVVDTSYHPFTTLVASNGDPKAVVTVVVSTRPPISGTYSNLGGGSLGADGTTYTVSGSAAAVTAALAGVKLLPTAGSPAESGLTASVSDGSSAVNTQLQDTGTAGSRLTAAAPGDVVAAGSGADTLLGGAAGTMLIGGAGADVLVGSTGGGTLVGGSGSSTLFSEGGATLIVGNGAADVVSVQAGNATVISAAGGHTIVGLSSGPALVNAQGADTLIAGSGSLVAGVAAGSVVVLSTGNATISAASGSTVVGGAGADTVGVRGSGILLRFNWSSQHLFAPPSVPGRVPRQAFASQVSYAAGR